LIGRRDTYNPEPQNRPAGSSGLVPAQISLGSTSAVASTAAATWKQGSTQPWKNRQRDGRSSSAGAKSMTGGAGAASVNQKSPSGIARPRPRALILVGDLEARAVALEQPLQRLVHQVGGQPRHGDGVGAREAALAPAQRARHRLVGWAGE
jgi:hypothetical protein